MKASFLERLGAYFLDTIIIGLISSIVLAGIPVNDNEINIKMNEISQSYINGEMTADTYLEEYQELLYDSQKSSMLDMGISLVLTIGYFVVFQYMNKGKTFGKMALGIKVVDKDTNESISMVKGFLRSFIVLGILTSALQMIMLNVLSRENYMSGYLGINLFQIIFLVVCVIMILYRKDGRGLHDLMANSLVVREER